MRAAQKSSKADGGLIVHQLRRSGKLLVRPSQIEQLTGVSPDFYERIPRSELPRIEYSSKMVLYEVEDLLAFWRRYKNDGSSN